jgi:phosphoglycolate phosphatase-like HAD superfamily hydrolase
MNNRLIALDADGVLLDYHRAYADVWGKTFGLVPPLKDPQAYWPQDRWHVTHLTGPELAAFRVRFDEVFWSTVPALEGAVQACQDLVSCGFELVCVSALETTFASARLNNLRTLGFPIESVIATGNDASIMSPKAQAIEKLQPAAFVDDFLPYHRGVLPTVHKALIRREENGSPNVGPELAGVDSQHLDLRAFVQWWLARDEAPSHRSS